MVVHSPYEASWELEDELDAPRHARHLTADTLSAWGIDGFSDGAQLVVSELVTNALVHAQSCSCLMLRYDGNKLWIGVRDHGDGEAVQRTSTGIGGWGLKVVESQSDDWGTERHHDGGKTIWSEMLPPWETNGHHANA